MVSSSAVSRRQIPRVFVHQVFDGRDHVVVLLPGLDGLNHHAICQPGVFLWIDGQRSALLPRSSRILLPAPSKTTNGATKSAVLMP